MEIDGVPVFYIPYFYQPDPTVERKTGLLIPTFGASSDIGFFVQQPVYIVLSPQSDITLTPWITTNEGPLLEGQYRQALAQGKVDFNGSITRDSRQRVRGHIFGEARYDINEHWRAGLDVERSQGRTYLRRYNFSDDRALTSRLFAERFDQSNYFVGQALSFQGLRSDDDNNEIPVVAPKLDYYYLSGIDPLGGRTNIQFDTAAFTREDGGDNQRVSTRADWELPFVGVIGDVFKVSAGVWGDAYHASNIRRAPDNDRYSGTSARLFPQAGVEWRMPFVRDGESVQQIVEPIVEGIVAPNFGNPSSIPNEDSRDFEYDDSNVFGFRRFAGLDRVEQGPRFNYGLNWSFFGDEASRTTFFAGQSYRFFEDDVFKNGSGLESNLSDVVTSIDISPQEYFDLTYRNRIDVTNAKVRRHELSSNIGTPALNTYVGYVFFDRLKSGDTANDQEGVVTQDRQELDFAINAQLTRMWRARIRGIRDLEANSQRSIGLTLSYEDECLIFSVGYRRRNFDDRDLESSDAVFFRVTFKTIGGFGAGLQERGLGS
ncbi:MAG: LPS-assembly protein LptD [Hyphomicrobiales bacterium]|nr:LPS-assembly protein LptD [Hyphomicrobiales bacterium]